MKERRGEMEESGGEIEGRDEIWEGGRGAERWRREEGEMRYETEGRGEISDEGERRRSREMGERGGGD